VNYAPGSTLSVDGRDFELKQYHFHEPSENLVNGKSYPMEVHLVHADKDGNLAVVAVMFVEGAENASLARAWAHLPDKAGEKISLSSVAAEGLLPTKRDYYRYDGSLTTPPCSEGVRPERTGDCFASPDRGVRARHASFEQPSRAAA
jgi:carbonic anhydrase